MTRELLDVLAILGDISIIVGAPTAIWHIHRLRAENRRLRAALSRQTGRQTPA